MGTLRKASVPLVCREFAATLGDDVVEILPPYNLGASFRIAKLANISSITMIFDTHNVLQVTYLYIHEVYKPTNITGGPGIVWALT